MSETTTQTTPLLSIHHEGEILRKKNLKGHRLALTVKSSDEPRSRCHILPRSNKFEFLFPGSIVRVISSKEQVYNGGGECEVVDFVKDVLLIKSSSDPTCVRVVLQGVLDGRYDPSTVCSTQDELGNRQGKDIESREFTNLLIRRIQGKSDDKGPPRKRLPHTSKMDVALLERLEEEGRSGDRGWRLECPVVCQTKEMDEEGGNNHASLPLNLPEGADSDPRRVNYINQKKEPQIQWMIARMKRGKFITSQTRHVVDVGGGRGDLAVRIALEFPEVTVIIVDINERSLRAAQEYAEAVGVSSRIRTVAQDFRTYEPSEEDEMVDLVCGLHACGDLSDLAIDFAQRKRCSFMLCPCCYTKRYIRDFLPSWCGLCSISDQQGDGEQEETGDGINKRDNSKVIARLAETDFRPDISSRARCLINSMRLSCIVSEEQQQYQAALEQYCGETSKRNQVLMGIIL